MRNRFEEYLCEKNNSLVDRAMKKEIFDWNMRFFLIDNCCHSVDDLSATLWGKFKVISLIIISLQN